MRLFYRALSVAIALCVMTAGLARPASGQDVDRDVERIRGATARFRSLDTAVAAGYPRNVSHCMARPEGGMGYHVSNSALMDATIELERPEILTYARTPEGEFELTGVEYVIPLDQWKAKDPPQVMGQAMKRAPSLGIWYLHVWVWRANPNGLFADWNPGVQC